MMEEYISYIIISLDTHTLDFDELKFMRANITAMRILDPTSYDVTNGKISGFFFSTICLISILIIKSDSRLGAW